MTYNKGDIVKFQNPWYKLSWFDRKFGSSILKDFTYHISGYMNPGHLNRISNKQPNQIILAERLEVKHNDLFVVQEYFSEHVVIKEFNSKTNLQYLAFCDKYVAVDPGEEARFKRNIRKQKIKKIMQSKIL